MLQKPVMAEIDIELQSLNNAISNHFTWANKLIEYHLFGERADESFTSPSAHRHCSFNHWLQAQLSYSDEYTAEIVAIENTHKVMHQQMRDLIISLENQCVSREKLNAFFNAQQHFLKAIDAYKTSVITLRNCYDTLTGLPLRQVLYKDFAIMQKRCQQKGTMVYLTLIDIDYFKSVNDTWGHNVGDIILKELAHMLSTHIRSTDRVYRFGGEEFVMLHECENHVAYENLTRRIMKLIRDHIFIIPGDTIKITATCGSAVAHEYDELQCIIEHADKAMYYGKQHGRNQCRLWHDSMMLPIGIIPTIAVNN